MGTITANFDATDFQCRCTACFDKPARPITRVGMVYSIQALRDRLGKPIVVACGVRCPPHNQAIGGAPDSRHLPSHCDAVDIAVTGSEERYEVVKAAIELGEFTCIEVCAEHVHLDQRPGKQIMLVSLNG